MISNDETVRTNTVHDLKDFNSQSSATPVKKGEQLASIRPAPKKVFEFLGDDIVELPTKTEFLKKNRPLR